MGARTGHEFLNGLKNTRRELWLENERVEDVASHRMLAGGARTMAKVFDLQHEYPDECLVPDPETKEPINICHIIPRSKQDLQRRHKCLARVHSFTLGQMGRTPDYVNICFAGFAGQASLWAGADNRNERGAVNLIEYQKKLRRNDLSTTHALAHQTIDKSRDNLVSGKHHALRKIGDTQTGIIVSGARILATLAPYADELTVWTGQPLRQRDAHAYALCFAIPIDTPGLILLCRDSFAAVGANSFDHPISANFDEQDAFVIFDNVEVPKERIFIDGDVELYNEVLSRGFLPNVQQQTTVRALTKLEFAYGLSSRMADAINDHSETTVDMLGELLCYIELTRSALLLSEEHSYDHGDGVFFPDERPLNPLRAVMTDWIPRAMEIVTLIGGHNLLTTPSWAMLSAPRIRSSLDACLTSANGLGADERSALFRLAWDFVGSSLAGRQQLYERFYIRSGRSNRRLMYADEITIPAAASRSPLSDRMRTHERAGRLVDDILSRCRS
jgi:4-hydroxyphenylacetate 3-monooxygenase